MKNTKLINLYSYADWKYHKNRLGFDDLVDERGNFVVTVNVIDLAVDEMLNDSYVKSGVPKEFFVLEEDGCWSIYLNKKWLTPVNMKLVLGRFGKMLGKNFKFNPYIFPAKLVRKHKKTAVKIASNLKNFNQLKIKNNKPQDRPEPQAKILNKRLGEIMLQKLKF